MSTRTLSLDEEGAPTAFAPYLVVALDGMNPLAGSQRFSLGPPRDGLRSIPATRVVP